MNMQNGQAMQAPASRVASPGKGRTAACGRNQSKMPTSSREKPKMMLAWFGRLAEEARLEGRQRRAEIWRTTSNSFSRFLGGQDIGFRQMEGRLLRRYEDWLLAGGLCPNTCSFYLRNLRSACNKAVEARLCPKPKQNPFAEVYTGVAKTRKRAVCADTLRAIREMNLDGQPDLDYARNLFLLSFYTRGMAFVDMAGLRQSDLKEGILCYVRRKTGKPVFIHWEGRMQEAVEALWRNAEAMGQMRGAKPFRRDAGRDAGGENGYLLPIVRDGEAHARSSYRNVQYKVNQGLKEIGKMLGLKMPLTMYVARHSWASLAKSKEVPLAIISDGLGHASEKVTRIYLATLDMNAVDEANRMIINGI